MFPKMADITEALASRNQARAFQNWREAESLVAARWRVFLDAEDENRAFAFASYAAALDAEEAAAGDLAAQSLPMAA
jgi:hypothetical protein